MKNFSTALFIYLGGTELGDPLWGPVSDANSELIIDLDLKAVVLGDNEGLEDAGVVGVREDGLTWHNRYARAREES